MLHADKAALERRLRVEMIGLQWRELEYLHSQLQNLATSSALLVGFGFTAMGITTSFHPEQHLTPDLTIWELPSSHWRSWNFISEIVLQATFFISTAFGLGFNLLALFISTLSIMCGPGLALRGPEGSVVTAVRHLEELIEPR